MSYCEKLYREDVENVSSSLEFLAVALGELNGNDHDHVFNQNRGLYNLLRILSEKLDNAGHRKTAQVVDHPGRIEERYQRQHNQMEN